MYLKSDSGRPLLIVTIDPGSSLTKVIYCVKADETKLLQMEPAIVTVTETALEKYQSKQSLSVAPKNEAWVEYGGLYQAVGFLAQEHFKAKVVLKHVKYEGAIAKILAAIGVIGLRMGLPEEFDVVLGVPLPYSEYESRSIFRTRLIEALESFSFRDKLYRVGVQKCVCVPEGGGHTMVRSSRIGGAYREMHIASVMGGWRDYSVVREHRGITSGTTEEYGMQLMIEQIRQSTFGLETEPLLKAVYEAGSEIKRNKFKALTRSQGEANKREEAAQIAEAIRTARIDYWMRVSQFLQAEIPSDVDEIIVGGGTSRYLRVELSNWLPKVFLRAHLSWSAELEEDVRVIFKLGDDQDGLSPRLTDAYGLFCYLKDLIIPVPVAVNSKTCLM